ncbi:filamentous hemagglutinin N-terminal domain-containing protein [Anabaena cylindrica FACHB-243]|uniref:Filamentous hemagglutinin family outer membrane protein n=1 Tax=Anabaena cylindrica (strain ATCC 27899 / PCC 7122) TaxID=272123 RepID=K9ZQC8_ANACC|nr:MULTISPECIES: filamentous hemagglutinin N-terminal domain-containing protein [Anabaena]AFZ61381.1 filamentous hemagglutinin family outer membrane protein [Anabaena cylindrica PCC 7122]MBD2420377.1 filamentous hemagglutinin N-terminal domain-containing protein [Anabaena cylindrica FACHB-243]MBY5281869.1 filamentous hemagglutinin N-terminal domain-containing protein [Anabaena sp. CCAP 1446/1C]MBY5306982.1 filamentous hemagglutinin N-terminal domain-containing protein [Anabaena sp. CCAP 1446/1C
MIPKLYSMALMFNKICQQSLLLVTLSLLNNGHVAQAQLIPVADTTLGSENSQIIPIGINNHIIQGGANRGNNLFHSFKEFHVDNGRGVFFISPSGIDNIIGRVTGTNASNILGNLGVLDNSFNIDNANLFLINPNGVYFGANAGLFLGGSFVASTADGLLFDNRFEFSASHPNNPPLMTVNIPVGLQFRETAGNGIIQPINVEGSFLEGAEGKTVALVGGEINFNNARLTVLDGKIELGSIEGEHLINISSNSQKLTFNYPQIDSQTSQNINFLNDTHIDVNGQGGFVNIYGDKISLNSSQIRANGNQGGININSNSFDARFGVLSTTTGNSGLPGNIFVKVNDSINLTFSRIDSDNFFSFEPADSGNISLEAGGLISLDLSFINTGVSLFTPGNGGDITIKANSLNLSNASRIRATTDGEGNAGNITVVLNDKLSLDRASILTNVSSGAVGIGGDINIKTNSLSLTNVGSIVSGTLGILEAGNINIEANTIDLDNSVITSATGDLLGLASGSVILGDGGNAGQLDIKTNTLKLNNGSFVITSTLNSGNGGTLNINVTDSLEVTKSLNNNQDFSSITTLTLGTGNAGKLNIETSNLKVNNQGIISTSSGTDVPFFVDYLGDLALGNGGNAGKLTIITDTLLIENGGKVITSTLNSGQGGLLTINANNFVEIIGNLNNPANLSLITTATSDTGNAGDLNLTTDKLILRDFGRISASTLESIGQGGNININAQESVNISRGAGIQAQTFADGNAGNVTLETRRLTLENGGTISTGTNRNTTGQGGNININATESINLSGTITNPNDILPIPSALTTATRGTGNAGNITINTPNLTATNGGVIATSTSPESTGDGGDLTANINILRISGISPEGLITSALSTDTTGKGDAGNIDLSARQIFLENGGLISGSTASQGKGGTLNINANESININGTALNGQPSAILAISGIEGIPRNPLLIDVPLNPANSTGKAGDINIKTPQLIVESGGKIAVTTQGQGDAGNINLKVSDNINLNGNNSGIFANTTTDSTGKGGNIFIDPITVSVENGAAIAVDSQGSGIGGDIDLITQNLFLDNGKISATTASNTGGNIKLQVANYSLLRNNSLISTTAGSEGGAGAGGNISIDTKFLIAVPFENSDITANSFGGQGGKINITAEGIFGLEIRNQLTPFSDITAFSQLDPTLNGQIILNIPETDPSNDLTELPESVVDPDQLIAQNPCKQGKESQFVNTGRGGLPPSPEQAVGNNFTQVDLVEPVTTGKQKPDNWQLSSKENHSQPITPVRGWMLNEKGQLILTAYDPKSNFEQRQNQKSSSCNHKN